jgi:ATP-dependent RNA helicase DeaD
LQSAQIVIGTPGRTLDHLRKGSLAVDHLSLFVLDEADEMLDRGFAPDVERILAYAILNTGQPYHPACRPSSASLPAAA